MKIILFCLILITNFVVNSQCPPSTTCTVAWTTNVVHDLDELLDEHGFRATATFSY